MGMISTIAMNGITTNVKEFGLLTLSVTAYLACRLLTPANIVSGTPAFLWTTGVIAMIGTVVTTAALVDQWNDGHGRPIVFGFDAAATYFLHSLCFFLLAALTIGKLPTKRSVAILATIFFPMVVFAASLVRFTFVSLVGTLFLAAMVSDSRKRAITITATITAVLLAVAIGLIARSDRTRVFVDYVSERTLPREAEGSKDAPSKDAPTKDAPSKDAPSCHLKPNLENPVSIRKALLQDALFLIPKAGWFGTGLDSFMRFSCIQSTQIHNTFLQAATEFGWFGGAVLLLLTAMSGARLLPLAKRDDATRFVLCSLVFVVLLSFAHGRLSRDTALFAFLGCAVAMREAAAGQAPLTGVAEKA